MRFLIVTAVLFAALPLAAQQRAAVGEKVPDATFPDFANGDGRQKLSDFFGQPVVIDQWGTRCGPCVGVAVPAAIKHDEEHKQDGLVTILVESQNTTGDEYERFMWKTFPQNRCFACTGTFVPIPESNGIPHCGVIGVDGTLLWAGNPAAFPKQVEDLVEQELKKVKKGWGDTAAARKMRAALYGKGRFDAAAAAVDELPDGDEKTALRAELDKRYATMKGAVENLKARGEWLAAHEGALALQKNVGKLEPWAGETAALAAEFQSEAAKAELAAADQLEKVLVKMRKGDLDKAPKALEKVAGKVGQTSAGAKAQRILQALASE